jgi:hypothetical protein
MGGAAPAGTDLSDDGFAFGASQRGRGSGPDGDASPRTPWARAAHCAAAPCSPPGPRCVRGGEHGPGGGADRGPGGGGGSDDAAAQEELLAAAAAAAARAAGGGFSTGHGAARRAPAGAAGPAAAAVAPGAAGLRLGVSTHLPAPVALAPGGAECASRCVVAPNGMAYAAASDRPGLLPRMLYEIPATRATVKSAMRRAPTGDKARRPRGGRAGAGAPGLSSGSRGRALPCSTAASMSSPFPQLAQPPLHPQNRQNLQPPA